VRFPLLAQPSPLVVGGWGTRGKSGTERLKAALFNAVGLGVVSKTGCEAMFLHAHPFGPMKEMFLFRPTTATIWNKPTSCASPACSKPTSCSGNAWASRRRRRSASTLVDAR
jgi:hypothetical protein